VIRDPDAKSSVPATSPIIILDAGPLVALADAGDRHRAWAAAQIGGTNRPFIVTSAAIAEATHVLKNGPRALEFLEKIVERMHVEDPPPVAVLAEMRKWGQRMDYADACAVLLARRHKGAVVLTTDHRDFSVYRVPFVSPKGEFHG
jgi:predicted nucleic acid-binding protein